MAFWNRKAAPAVREQSHVYAIHAGEVRAITDISNLDDLLTGYTVNGVPVGSEAALTYPASAACIRLISTLCAAVPLHVYRRTGDDSRERMREHVAENLLNGFASPWKPSDEMVREMTVTAQLQGEAFAKVVRVRGEARELHPISATVECDRDTGEPRYRVTRANGLQEVLRYPDVLHLKSPTGSAPAQKAASAINLGLLLQKSAVDLFKNGGRPSALLIFKKAVDPDTARAVRAAWDEMTADEDLAGGPAVLGHDVSYVPLTLSSTDAEHLSNRKMQILEVARHWGVSPTLLAELADASLNNSEALGRQFVTFTLSPWLDAWRGAITRALIAPEARADIYAEHETAALQAADFKATAEALKFLVAGPIMTPNDARGKLNMPATDDGNALYPVQGAAPVAAPPTP
ncbi:MAG: Phage portal protein [Devosia sp.]|uniref:phage portal protein n=1 Tax=Devosia sp. TaxID=1871048 RepID=UPI0026229801|nr:phage portal protein [Devosia sp.]MDB5541389.1 Phage portal protein [Devosia sp.]